MNKKMVYVVISATLALVVAFCGCLGQSPPAGATTAPEDSGLRIITEDFPPFNYMDENGRVSGQSTDVVNEILRRLNQKADIELMEWSSGYNIALNEPSTALYSTVRTGERESLFRWAGPIASYENVFYAKADSGIKINSLEASKKAGNIAVVRDDSRQQFLTANGFENLLLCSDDRECMTKLMSGEASLWFGSDVNAADIAAAEGYDASAIAAVYPVRTVDMYIAFNPAVPDETVSGWQNALDSMKEDGTYNAILVRYGNAPASSPQVTASGSEMETGLFAIMSYTDGKIASVLRGLEVAAVTGEAGSGDWQEIKPVLAALEEKEPDARMWYAHTNGTYYTVVDDLASANLMSRSYFPGVLAGQESVGTVVVSHSTGKNTAIAAVPVKVGGKVTGVLGASIYLEGITGTLKDELPGTVFYAIDSEGKFALNSDTGLISQDALLNDGSTSFGRAVEYMVSQGKGTTAYDYEGKKWNAVSRKSPLTGWIYVTAVSAGS